MPRNKKKPHPHPACHSGVECSRTIFWFSGVSLRGMPAQKTPSFASPAHARFAKVFSFAGCSRLLVLSYTVRDAKGVIRWRALIFPLGHPALALALFYQIWPCPCKCPNGHKNGICACFYPKSAISCRACPMNPPKSLCTSPTKSYKFVSANPCETDAGRINKYHYTGCVGGSFWNFIRFRDFRKRCKTSPSSSLTLDATSPVRRGFGIPSRFPAKPNRFHRKRNLFAKGSPARKDSPGRGSLS